MAMGEEVSFKGLFISIPCGAIRWIFPSVIPINNNISIPCGAIRCQYPKYLIYAIPKFQFLVVRLDEACQNMLKHFNVFQFLVVRLDGF